MSELLILSCGAAVPDRCRKNLRALCAVRGVDLGRGEVDAATAVTLLERARGEARQECRRAVQEMDALEPERG